MDLKTGTLALLIAAASGILMALQGSLNSGLGKAHGLWQATFYVHVVGLAFISILLFGFRLQEGSIFDLGKAPWYLYLGGILGVGITYTVVRSISQIGVALATTAIIIGQVLTASLIDHLGLFGLERVPFTWYRVVGTALLALGGWFMLKN
ncbi:MAG TPA: DMT family transporter [Firmicutes bacterium]|jgi:transporter family-2 protein|nr:DMT family transporter [Bacillota bacterium]